VLLASALTEVIPATLLLIAITVVGFLILMKLKKSLNSNPEQTTTFSLRDIERLRDEGQMSEDEYERARQSIIDAAKKMTSDIPGKSNL
tara:strand:- start:361 stop:627 length:267 start_codon:yes stop_codon:yes gene_type:complete